MGGGAAPPWRKDLHGSFSGKALLSLYSILFVLCLLVVLRVLPYGIAFAAVLACVLLADRNTLCRVDYSLILATVYKGNIIKNLIMDCQSYTKYRPNETTGGIFVSWRRKEELPTGA